MDSSIEATVDYCAGRVATLCGGDKEEIKADMMEALKRNGHVNVEEAFAIDQEVVIALTGQLIADRPTDPIRELLELPVHELCPLVDDTPMHKQHGYWRQFEKPKKNRNKNL